MKRILLCGEHPLSGTGNGNMMAAILSQIDLTKYQIACFVADYQDSWILNCFRPFPFSLIDAGDDWGPDKLLKILRTAKVDVFLMIGIDLWRYAHIFQQIHELRKQRGFKWGAIFPYDLQTLRADWVDWINLLDFPCVYSQYGLEMLKDHVAKIRYFKPPLNNAELFKPLEDRIEIRRDLFPTLRDDDLVFGFIGINAFRKDIPRFIKAFMEAKEQIPGIRIYLHTELDGGVHNLQQTAFDYGGKSGDMLAKDQGIRSSVAHMIKIYNIIDCLVNCTMQEGLSWTPLEAMLCGTPVIASDTTAQTEIVKGAGLLIPCEELSYVPIITGSGQSFVDAKSCKVEAIKDAIISVASKPERRQEMRDAGLDKAKEWLAGVSNINLLLAEATFEKVMVSSKISKVLFAQCSSAGDVLMSTQCFKGIKERHKGMKLIYMTQLRYMDIVEGNSYIDEIVPWDPDLLQKYEIVYNPHEERILPGNFNSGDVRLHEMYPYFCKVEADDMFIKEISPNIINTEDDYDEDERFEIDYGEWPKEYIVVHTTGGASEIRTYKHMDLALKGLDFPIVHIGGATDMACHEAAFDLRGKLSWREAAWVMARAKAAVVMDSFPAHLAGVLGTPVVVLYGPAPARVTGPKGNEDKVINLEPNWLDVCPVVAACYGTRGCSSPCINTINPMTVRKSLCEFL